MFIWKMNIFNSKEIRNCDQSCENRKPKAENEDTKSRTKKKIVSEDNLRLLDDAIRF